MFAFVLLGALGVAHVGLRFQIIDSRLQQSKMQETVRSLQLEVDQLEHQKEAICDAQTLRDFGKRQMEMVEADLRVQPTVVMAADLRDKYLKGSSSAGSAVAMAGELEKPEKSFLMSLMDTRSAFAADKP
ncbi:hypothetical protein CVU37_04725 [candidate division BRC1 bacterium HGW-BRC1-1]|nr:MAG: hypothetical protein CVU37_04725 [candidate division BRC1 bacterium HGW-BRC1-1]